MDIPMSNQIVSDVSTMVRHGKFRVHSQNKGLERPRFVRSGVEKTSCISLGQVDGQGNGGKGMQFSGKRPEEVYGVKK